MSRPTIIFPKTNDTLFEELEIGEIFQYGESILVKTDVILDINGDIMANCTSLSTGCLLCFNNDDIIKRVKAEIRISYEK